MNRTTKIFISILAILMILQGVSAQTLYVAKTGSDNNPGTEASPFYTIQKAADTVNAGDVVVIKAGTYKEHIIFTRSGAANNYITFKNYNTDVVNIQSPVKPYSYAEPKDGNVQFHTPGAYSGGASFIELTGLNFINSANNEGRLDCDSSSRDCFSGLASVMIASGAHDIIIDGNDFDNLDFAAVFAGGSTGSVYNITIVNNTMSRPTTWVWAELVTINNVNTFTFDNNVVTEHQQGECIVINEGSHNGVVSNNVISDCYNTYDNSWYYYLSQGIYLGGYESGAHDIQVYGNVLDNTKGIDIGCEHGCEAYNIDIFNNVIKNSYFGVYIVPYSSQSPGEPCCYPTPDIHDINVFSNTLYGIGTGLGSHGDIAPIWIDDSSTGAFSNIVIKNNLAYASNSPDIGGNAASSYNSWDLSVDSPDFDNAPSDLHIGASSEALNVGATLGSPFNVDADGKERPAGAGYDLGAYEYNGSTPTPTATPTPPPTPDNTDPTITITLPVSTTYNKSGSYTVDFACSDNVAISSCTGTIADGNALTTSTEGQFVFTVTATDTSSNTVTKKVTYSVWAASSGGSGYTSSATYYWKLDETSGTSVADDKGLKSLTASGTTIIDGKYGKARQFDGTDDYLSGANVGSDSAGTTMLWFKPDSPVYTSDSMLVGSVQSNGADTSHRHGINLRGDCGASWGMMVADGTNSAMVCSGENVNSTTMPTTEWTHLAITWDGTTVKFYRDGNLVGSASQPNSAAGSEVAFAIGDYGAKLIHFTDGAIDEVKIFKGTALTEAQIEQEMLDEDAAGSGTYTIRDIYVSADSYTDGRINPNFADTEYGNANTLATFIGGGTPFQQIWVYAPFTSIPSGATINTAYLHLYGQAVSRNNLYMNRVTATWDESTINGNSSISKNYDADIFYVTPAMGWHIANATNMTVDILGATNYGIEIDYGAGALSRSASFASRENETNVPFFRVNYTEAE